jgi:hypothetical protein
MLSTVTQRIHAPARSGGGRVASGASRGLACKTTRRTPVPPCSCNASRRAPLADGMRRGYARTNEGQMKPAISPYGVGKIVDRNRERPVPLGDIDSLLSTSAGACERLEIGSDLSARCMRRKQVDLQPAPPAVGKGVHFRRPRRGAGPPPLWRGAGTGVGNPGLNLNRRS